MTKKRPIGFLIGVFLSYSLIACSSLPSDNFKEYSFPTEHAFIGDVKRPYAAMGTVRAKVNYTSLDPSHEDSELCANYFNKAVRDMVHMAEEKGAQAVIDVKSVVFYEGGQREYYSKPECSDDGIEGQVLTEAIAIKWKE
jgi:hypothetical protein